LVLFQSQMSCFFVTVVIHWASSPFTSVNFLLEILRLPARILDVPPCAWYHN
jgi:hypothetical protein